MLITNKNLLKQVEASIERLSFGKSPKDLYNPIEYIMSLGGKRLRPLLTLMSYSLFKEPTDTLINQALAVEVFHNFTLMHDDIMDEAPLRRGKPTVHKKWNNNTATLSGDVMLVKAYEMLLAGDNFDKEIFSKFNACATGVCEGQQLDVDFENRKNVTVEEYLEMIRLKTAVLIGFSAELGGILSGTSGKNKQLLRQFGENIGIGFQLKDDLLDVYADQNKFGKQVGGDILANKKTYLLITALDLAKGPVKKELLKWLTDNDHNPKKKVEAVRNIYDSLDIRARTEAKINVYFDKAFSALKKIDAPLIRKGRLRLFTNQLIHREK